MAVHMRCAITVFTFLYVLAPLCSAGGHTDLSNSNENKITWPSNHASMHNNAGKTSNDRELRERAELLDVPRTCGNLGRKQLRNELLAYVTKQIFNSSSTQDRRKTSHPKSGSANTRAANELEASRRRGVKMSGKNTDGLKKHIVYANAVDHGKGTVKFILKAADIDETPVIIKLWVFNEKKGCLLRYRVNIDLSSNEEENKNCVLVMKTKRYYDLVTGKHHDPKEEGWVSFDVSLLTEKVMRSLQNMCNNAAKAVLGFRLKIPKCSLQGHGKEKYSNTRQPYMEILPKHQPAPLECTPGEKRCCRQTTKVMFEELGGNASFFFAPIRFRTGYCKGSCEGQPSGHQNGPCCQPTKTTSISALYIHRSRLGVRLLPHVVIKECGCR